MTKLNTRKYRKVSQGLAIFTSLAAATVPLVFPLQRVLGAPKLTTVLNFKGTNGADPQAGVYLASDGNLYGTTSSGGANNKGTVYKLTGANFSTLTTLVNFTGVSGNKQGTTPIARLFEASDDNLYGVTLLGGANNLGTVFKLKNPAFTALTTLVKFNGTNGSKPAGRLIEGDDGKLWGTTSAGGANNKGTVFNVSLKGGTPKVVVSFKGKNGSTPLARLLLGSDGNYYGTTSTGGGSNKGTVFKLTPAGALTSYNFNGSNGATPEAPIIESGKFLYGTTKLGGTNNKGVVYRVPLGGGTPAVVTSFNGSNGANPTAAIYEGSDGNFYGTTSAGGSAGKGTIFKLKGKTLSKLINFTGTKGANLGTSPDATLIQLKNGSYYGTTSAGGTSDKGTVFKFQP